MQTHRLTVCRFLQNIHLEQLQHCGQSAAQITVLFTAERQCTECLPMLERQAFTLHPQPILEIWHARKIGVRQQWPAVTGDCPLGFPGPQRRPEVVHIRLRFRFEAERVDHGFQAGPERRAAQTPQLLTQIRAGRIVGLIRP